MMKKIVEKLTNLDSRNIKYLLLVGLIICFGSNAIVIFGEEYVGQGLLRIFLHLIFLLGFIIIVIATYKGWSVFFKNDSRESEEVKQPWES